MNKCTFLILQHFLNVVVTSFSLCHFISMLPIKNRERALLIQGKTFFNGTHRRTHTFFFPLLADAEVPLLFSGDLHCGIRYHQAIRFLTIELSLAIKSSPFYPLLEMKLLGLSFISIFIKKNLMHCHFTLLPAMIA